MRDNPGPGAYRLRDGFDSEYSFGGKGIRKGFSMGGRRKPMLMPGTDSPGPKYDLSATEKVRFNTIGGAISKAKRFDPPPKPKKKSQKQNEEDLGGSGKRSQDGRDDQPPPLSYSPNVGVSSTYRTSTGVRFRPPFAKETKRLVPLEPKKERPPRGHLWRERLNKEEAQLREEGLVSDDVTIPTTTMGSRAATPGGTCSFGHRPRQTISCTPGPGSYENSDYRPTSRTYRYMDGPGHSDLFKGSAFADAPPLFPNIDALRPQSPAAVLYLTG